MIIPAILEKTSQGFAERVKQIKQLPDIERIQVDFADGQFVDNTTLAVGEIEKLDKKYDWEAHLMVHEPHNFADYQAAGFKTIIVHYESFASEAQLEAALLSIDQLGMTPAIAINPETLVSVLRYDTDTISRFTILGVHPGKQGQPFIPNTAERVAELRSIAPDATIEVDGAVKADNAKELIDAGANDLVVGSALFETDNIKQNYQAIVDAIK